jgi:hypothetical protein
MIEAVGHLEQVADMAEVAQAMALRPEGDQTSVPHAQIILAVVRSAPCERGRSLGG